MTTKNLLKKIIISPEGKKSTRFELIIRRVPGFVTTLARIPIDISLREDIKIAIRKYIQEENLITEEIKSQYYKKGTKFYCKYDAILKKERL